MKYKAIALVGIIAASVFGTLYLQPVNTTKGYARTSAIKTVTIYADRDTYLSYNNPSANYGGRSYMRVANYLGDSCHAWMHFSLDALPVNYTEIRLFVDIYGVSQTFHPRLYAYTQVGSYVTDYDWGEYIATFDRRPDMPGPQYFESFTCAEDNTYSFNVTVAFSGMINKSAGFSVNIQRAEAAEAGYAYVSTRESAYDPRIEVSYFTEDEEFPLHPNDAIGFPFSLPLFAMIASVSITMFRVRKKERLEINA